jgi:hypothetical protein
MSGLPASPVFRRRCRRSPPLLPPLGRFLPQLAVGFFCQENDRPAAHTRGSVVRFLAMGSGSRHPGCHHGSGICSLFHGNDLDGGTC